MLSALGVCTGYRYQQRERGQRTKKESSSDSHARIQSKPAAMVEVAPSLIAKCLLKSIYGLKSDFNVIDRTIHV